MSYTEQHTKMYFDVTFQVSGTSLLLLEFIVRRDILTQAVAMFLAIQSASKYLLSSPLNFRTRRVGMAEYIKTSTPSMLCHNQLLKS